MPKTSDNDVPVANITPFGLRMQPDLKRQIEEAAKLSGRSLNSEIVARLEASLQHEVSLSSVANEVEIENLRVGLRVEENERSMLTLRIERLEQALKELAINDRGYDHEMRIARIEAKIR
ncbi:Arc family DNA-binding protein [Rhizobium laguerreae]|uniref:Arc family DNA-binding protein n=1 Tax=Rhizobium laguerreae TaxID=1076926 RepID=UPI001C90ECA0|nr:Arc family DNA-binding protein [Rhizobium laguerreae]MBY3416769.1 Arc family DNA-binding protein [Rhizobium laguerreae]